MQNASYSLPTGAPSLLYGGTRPATAELAITQKAVLYDVSGVGPVSRLPALPAGTNVTLYLNDATTFTNSTRLRCPGGGDYVGFAGDVVTLRSRGNGRWQLTVQSAGKAAPNNVIDVCWVTGQSNAAASSESLSTSPTVPSGVALKWQSNALSDANDPVGNGSTGSAWPAFALSYYNLTGRPVCIVPTGVGSAAMCNEADTGAGSWDTVGTVYDGALTKYRDAIKALQAAGYIIGKQFVIDIQGETDAAAIYSSTITGSDFQSRKAAMFARIRSDLGNPTLPIYFSLLGGTSVINSGWDAVRSAQFAISVGDPYTKIAYWSADTFTARSLMQSASLHYKQAGYNEMGRELAKNIAAGLSTRGWESLGSGPYLNSSGLIYRGGKVGVGGDQTSIPTNLLHLFGDYYEVEMIESSHTGGAGFRLKPTATGGREFSLFASANGAGPGGGKFILWDATSGKGIFLDGATGALRLNGYGAGVPVFDSSGNITSISNAIVASRVAQASEVTLTSGTAAQIASISVPAGTWDIDVDAMFDITSSTTLNYLAAGLSTLNNSLQAYPNYGALTFDGGAGYSTTVGVSLRSPTVRVTLGSTTTYYFIARAGFGASTCKVYGGITARPVPIA